MTDGKLQRVKFPQAKSLKAAGFDYDCDLSYIVDSVGENHGIYWRPELERGTSKDQEFPAPTVALALKWMRDVKGIIGIVNYDAKQKSYDFYVCSRDGNGFLSKHCYQSYEQAESALLDAALAEIQKGD